MTEDHELTTLGRGGSDTSAVALAVALEAAFCEINTDVDGVYTCDPRIVPAARLIEIMDYEVALEMASLGSKVLHPRCVELGAKYRLPIVVRNTFTPDEHQRTRVMTLSNQQAIESLAVSGVTLDKDVARLTISGLPSGSNGISKLFSKVAAAGINVDIIVHDKPGPKGEPARLGFTVGKADLPATLAAIEDLRKDPGHQQLKAETESGLAKVSVVGVGMRSYAGVAGKTFAALNAAGIDIHMISTSEIKISCVVAESDGAKACQALHAAFFES
jgi:aspartate kinase